MKVSISFAALLAISSVAFAGNPVFVGQKLGCTQVKECGKPAITGAGVATAADAMNFGGTVNDPRGGGFGAAVSSGAGGPSNASLGGPNSGVGQSHANSNARGLQ